jgi:hypothetical protein
MELGTLAEVREGPKNAFGDLCSRTTTTKM